MGVNIRNKTLQECDLERRKIEDELICYIAMLTGQAAPLLSVDRAKLRDFIGRHRQWSSAMRRIRKRDEKRVRIECKHGYDACPECDAKEKNQ